MSQSQDYGFCPNCGAVSKNGVCSSCGYKSKSARFTKPSEGEVKPVQTVYDYTSSGNSEPARVNSSFAGGNSSANKGYLGLVIASIAAIIIFVTAFVVFHSLRFNGETVHKEKAIEATRGSITPAVSVSETSDLSESIDIYDPDYYDVFALKVFYDIDKFEVPEETVYAEESDYDYYDDIDYYIYDDYIRTDLNYKVLEKTWKYNGYYAEDYGDDYPEKAFIRFDYPVIESDSLSFAEEVNDTILDLTTYMCDYYDLFEEYLADNEVFYGEGYVYVTYMSEDVLSLLLIYNGYFYDDAFEEDEEPETVLATVKAVNIDMKSGEVMDMPALAMSESDFLDRFVADINAQNEIDFLSMTSMEEVEEVFNDGDIQWFYNPVGVEFMFAFPDLYGYFSCTEDPNEFFAK